MSEQFGDPSRWGNAPSRRIGLAGTDLFPASEGAPVASASDLEHVRIQFRHAADLARPKRNCLQQTHETFGYAWNPRRYADCSGLRFAIFDRKLRLTSQVRLGNERASMRLIEDVGHSDQA